MTWLTYEAIEGYEAVRSGEAESAVRRAVSLAQAARLARAVGLARAGVASVFGGAQAAVAAGVVDQRLPGGRAGSGTAGGRVRRAVHGGHAADDDAVVAAVVDGEGLTFQRGHRVVEHRRAGDRARVVRHLVELAFQRTAAG